jgi:DNA invertase Pin-like site-specific DNA recombinase
MSQSSREYAAIYTRISADQNGNALGVKRQEADARKLCKARGWEIFDVYTDNDVSAYNPRKVRADYQRMLADVAAGKINIIVAWHPDRLHRQMRELLPFIDFVNKHGVGVETVTAGKYDLSTPSGRLNARLLGDVAQYESEHRSERVRAKLKQNAENGVIHGGSRPYGWKKDRVTLDPKEAAVVRDCVARALAGQSIRSITRHLNDQGILSSRGLTWRDIHVKHMILRPRNANLRTYHGEIAGPGTWQPIISAEDFHQVQAILLNPARDTRATVGRSGAVHLLSQIARCGVCGGKMISSRDTTYQRRRGGAPMGIYRCESRKHVTRREDFVDDLVIRVILARLALPDARDLLAEPDLIDEGKAAARKVQQLRDRLDGAAAAYAAGVIDMEQLTKINGAIKPQLAQAQTTAASPSRSKVLGSFYQIGRTPSEVWEQLSPEQRRAVVRLLMDVTIMPTRRGFGFDPESIEITWRS